LAQFSNKSPKNEEGTIFHKDFFAFLTFSLRQGVFQYLDSILHALGKVMHFNLQGSQTLGSFRQNFFYLPFPVKNRLDLLLGHLFFYFFPHLLHPCRLIYPCSHDSISFLGKIKNLIFAPFQSIQKEIFAQEEIKFTRNPFLSVGGLENVFVVEPDSILHSWQLAGTSASAGETIEFCDRKLRSSGAIDKPRSGVFYVFC
jgi:hypothetical protein